MQHNWMKVTAGAVLAAGMMLAQSTTPAPAPQPGEGRAQGRGHMMNRNPEQRFERLATYLNLTAQQREQAKSLMDEAKAAAQPVMAQLKAGRQQLAEAVKAGKGEAEIERLSNQQGVLMGQLTAIRAKALEKGYALLTPEQRQKADQLRDHFQQMFHNRAGRNNG